MIRHEPDRYLTVVTREQIPSFTPPEWKLDAPCNGKAEQFHEAAEAKSYRSEAVRKAKKICNEECPFTDRCLAEALATEQHGVHNRWGVWGGKDPVEREDLATEGRMRPCAGCGVEIPFRRVRCEPCDAKVRAQRHAERRRKIAAQRAAAKGVAS